MPSNPAAIRTQLHGAYERLLDVYADRGGHNYYGWNDYDDPRNYMGPTFWSEQDGLYRLALELETVFPYQVHMEEVVP